MALMLAIEHHLLPGLPRQAHRSLSCTWAAVPIGGGGGLRVALLAPVAKRVAPLAPGVAIGKCKITVTVAPVSRHV